MASQAPKSERKFVGDLWKFLSETASEKWLAAQARLGRVAKSGPPPKEIHRKAVRSLAGAFAPDGFRLLSSKPHLKRPVAGSHPLGSVTIELHFGSSRNNVAGHLVDIHASLHVYADSLHSWRRHTRSPLVSKKGEPSRCAILAGNIGNAPDGGGYVSWNLADPRRRDDTLHRIESEIRRVALPTAEQARTCEGLIRLAGFNSVLVNVANSIEFCVMVRGREDGKAFLETWWAALPPGFRQTVMKAMRSLQDPKDPNRLLRSGHHATGLVILHYGWESVARL
jgi:hypothetical protein